MAKPSEFTTYYYSIQIEGDIDIEKYVSEVTSRLNNQEGFTIEEVEKNSVYFIQLANKYNANVLPKKGNSKNVDIRTLKTIELDDDEWLFLDMYITLSFKEVSLINKSAGIISVLKSWKQESSGILDAFFKEIFKVYNQVLNIIPITYKDQKKYLESLSKINKLSFKVAWANLQTQMWVSSDEWLTAFFDMRDKLWGDDFTLSISWRNGLKKNAVIEFIETYTHSFKNSTASVEVLDNVWKRVQQQVDEIRFKSTLSLIVTDGELNFEEVKTRMIDDFATTILQLRAEYTP